MGLLEGYYRLPIAAQELLLSAYGARLRMLRYGRGHAASLNALIATERLDREQMDRHQRELLLSTLQHAASTVPYYRAQRPALPGNAVEAVEALRDWPLLTKAAVQAAGRSLIAESGRGAKLSEIHTGGTTGRALAVWADADALRRNYAFFERLKRWAGIGAADRVATFAGRPLVPPHATRPPYWRRNFAAQQLLFSSYHLGPDTVEHYVRALERFRPRLLDSYPSSLEPIARRILARGGIKLDLKAIITSSETLYPEVRALFENAFGCPVFDHYGSAEMAAFVTQCAAGSYHPNAEFGYLEVLREDGSPADPGEQGEIVATGFINRAMPFVRYRMGDQAVASDAQCSCGRPYRVLASILGRTDDVIVTPDGRRVGRIDPIFKAVSTLHEARVVQTRLDHVVLELVAAPGFRDEDGLELKRQLSLRLGPLVEVEVQRVETIPRTPRGKLRTVESPFAKQP